MTAMNAMPEMLNRRGFAKVSAAGFGSFALAAHLESAWAQPADVEMGHLSNNLANVAGQSTMQVIAGNGQAVGAPFWYLIQIAHSVVAQALADRWPDAAWWSDSAARGGVWRDIAFTSGGTIVNGQAGALAFGIATNWRLGGVPNAVVGGISVVGGYLSAQLRFTLAYAMSQYLQRTKGWDAERSKWVSGFIMWLLQSTIHAGAAGLLTARFYEAFNQTAEGAARRRLLTDNSTFADAATPNYGPFIQNVAWTLDRLRVSRIGNVDRLSVDWSRFSAGTFDEVDLPITTANIDTFPTLTVRRRTPGSNIVFPQTIQMNPMLYRPAKVVSDSSGRVYILSRPNAYGFNIYSGASFPGSNTPTRLPYMRNISGQAVDIAAGNTRLWVINKLGLVYSSPIPSSNGAASWLNVPLPSGGGTAVSVAVARDWQDVNTRQTCVNGPVRAWIKTSNGSVFKRNEGSATGSWTAVPAFAVPPRVVSFLNEVPDRTKTINHIELRRYI